MISPTIKRKRAAELAGTEVMLVQTPDFDGAIEEGWTKAVTALIGLVPHEAPKRIIPDRINILPGWHLTVADLELLRETAEAFGLDAIITPDISGRARRHGAGPLDSDHLWRHLGRRDPRDGPLGPYHRDRRAHANAGAQAAKRSPACRLRCSRR